MLPITPNGAPTPHQASLSEPTFTDRTTPPQGVVKKNLKQLLIIGGVLVIVLASFVSSFRKKPGTAAKTKDTVALPTVQDHTATSVAALHAQLDEERRKQQEDSQLAQALVPNSSVTPAVAYGSNGLPVTATPCVSGQPCSAAGYVAPVPQQGGSSTGPAQLSPAQQAGQQLAAKERERQDAARFASNLVYSRSTQQEQVAGGFPSQPSNLTAPSAAGEQGTASKRATEVNVDAAVGQPYVIYEGLTLDTVLMNRIDGDAAGPVKVLVSNPVYSHDRQHVLVPDGTVVLGEAKKIGSAGFGQQRRIAVVFHRMLMPDGYSVDLDQFHGLDQIGQEGLKDKVNNHYLQIFGTSVALGVISGAAQITEGGTGYSATGPQAFTNGAAAGISQQATSVLDKFIQIPPTITIREGHRVKVYFTQDLLLPAYENHRIAQSF